jgi:uncharacterized protein YqjF (DUF2071 family)
MSVDVQNKQVQYSSTRTHRNAPPAKLRMHYHPTGSPYSTREGNLDHFLTNRLCLFSTDRKGRLHRGDITHEPWPLQSAEAEIQLNEMTRQIGVDLPPIPPLLHYAERLDVVARRIERV